MKRVVVAVALFATLGLGGAVFAAEPTLHEVYQAADSGKLDAAQQMMSEVLRAHPNSGKAHYVEAELLAKQGRLTQAANELASAEKLAPGLPFATAQSVSGLRASIASRPTAATTSMAPRYAVQATPRPSGFPWGMLLIGFGLVAFIVWATRFMANRNQPAANWPAQPGTAGYPGYPASPYGGGTVVYPPAAGAAGPGLGSQMLGGLATGAAVGAGVVAGEALMHRLIDGHPAAPTGNQSFSSFDNIPSLPSTPLDDMGGNDFGIADNASWDDSGSTDSDWN